MIHLEQFAQDTSRIYVEFKKQKHILEIKYSENQKTEEQEDDIKAMFKVYLICICYMDIVLFEA